MTTTLSFVQHFRTTLLFQSLWVWKMTNEVTSIGNFIVKELVGQGSFSEVYNCVLPECGNIYFAIKRLLSTCSSKKIVNEIVSLYLLRVLFFLCINSRIVPNTVSLLGITMQMRLPKLIFPYFESDDFTLFILRLHFQRCSLS